MILVDASVLVAATRDRTGAHARRLLEFAGDEEIIVCRFTELELLAGTKDEAEWRSLKSYFAAVGVLEPLPTTWSDAARIYFDLRRDGLTIRSIIDCCIAQIALDAGATLVHDDRDFDAIATVRPLKLHRLPRR